MPDAKNTYHYTHSKTGVECISISHAMSANLAQAFQYVWRHEFKDDPFDDLVKARQFIIFERKKLAKAYGFEDAGAAMQTVMAAEPDVEKSTLLVTLFEASRVLPESAPNLLQVAELLVLQLQDRYRAGRSSAKKTSKDKS